MQQGGRILALNILFAPPLRWDGLGASAIVVSPFRARGGVSRPARRRSQHLVPLPSLAATQGAANGEVEGWAG